MSFVGGGQFQRHRLSNPVVPPPSSSGNGDVHIYCAGCKRPWSLNECYACTECISGVCRECVGFLLGSPPSSFVSMNGQISGGGGPTSFPNPIRGCPRCRTVGGQWKAFQLDVR